MANQEERDRAIRVLLAEYQACHVNRNHYDSVRWTIGSIFIATSLTLLGISFIQEVRNRFWEVLLIAIFSFLMISIWHAYNQHVNPNVMASIVRLHSIELELHRMGFDTRLHESIFDATEGQIRGAWITYFLLVTVSGAWVFRLAFFLQELYILPHLIALLVCLIFAIIIYVIHMERLNRRNWRLEGIQDIIRQRREIRQRRQDEI